MSTEDRQDLLAKVGGERRDFLKKIAIAAAFATPAITTISIDGMRKKAFAQAAYDPPEVINLEGGLDQAVVTFSQPMIPIGAADSLPRVLPGGPCSTFAVTGGEVVSVTWSGNTQQVIEFCAFGTETLTVTYNWGDCIGLDRYMGENGLELVPYSGSVTVSGHCKK